jgi:hypothetical protein
LVADSGLITQPSYDFGTLGWYPVATLTLWLQPKLVLPGRLVGNETQLEVGLAATLEVDAVLEEPGD